MKFLTLEQILAIYELLLEETGGGSGVRDQGRLESVVATQTQAVFGAEIYESPHDKAAALIRGIIADHPFVDGNKRTGMLSGLTFLEINGEDTKVNEGDLEDFAVKVATDKLSVEEIAEWLKAHSEPQK
ncbi:MAG: type II toxin-antitoxin system death-on-curing family toxin [Candidatus Saccharibacteria bacterium]|nr:type II toxin-antitoxin system death-on-curing family toxin [Candidatus Saccharibacteria bacterium]